MTKKKDTYYRMPWSELLRLIKRNGFVVVHESTRSGRSDQQVILAAHPEKKLLLWSSSYQYGSEEPRMDGGSVEGFVRHGGDQTFEGLYRALGGISHGAFMDNDFAHFTIHFITGPLIEKLDGLSEYEFIPWTPEKSESTLRVFFSELDEDMTSFLENDAPQWMLQFLGL